MPNAAAIPTPAMHCPCFLAEARLVSKIPVIQDAKHPKDSPYAGQTMTDANGLPVKTRRMVRLGFHCAKLTLLHTHPSGTAKNFHQNTSTLTHTISRSGVHHVVWENAAGFRRSFHHPHNLADFLVGKFGLPATEMILATLASLEP